MRNGRQPSRLPFALPWWSLFRLAVAWIALASPAAVRAQGDDIRVVVVDSNRLHDPQEAARPQSVPKPVTESAEKAAGDISATGVGTILLDDKGDAVVPSFLPHVWREGRWQLRK
jgi:hypothetical protein